MIEPDLPCEVFNLVRVRNPKKYLAHKAIAMSEASRHLYIHRLPPEATEENLRAIFVPFGDITDLHLPQDSTTRAHRGYAFVSFDQPEDAHHAILNLDLANFFGKTIRVTTAAGRRPRQTDDFDLHTDNQSS